VRGGYHLAHQRPSTSAMGIGEITLSPATSKRPDRHWRDEKRPFGDAYRLSTADNYWVSLWVYDRLAHMALQAHKDG
jgi:hypothetical protein